MTRTRRSRLAPVLLLPALLALPGRAEDGSVPFGSERWTITGLSKVGKPDLQSVHDADIVLVGTWTHGLFVVGQTPFALGNIANLPTMRGKQAACFLTFALNAGTSIDKLTTAVGQTGADVVGGLEIKRNYLDEHTDLFVERLLGVVEPV